MTTPSEVLGLDLSNAKKAAIILRAFNHKLRQKMLKLIGEYKKITVTEIYVELRLDNKTVASQHLAILRKAGFVNTERDGKFIHYSVNTSRLEEIKKFAEQLLGEN